MDEGTTNFLVDGETHRTTITARLENFDRQFQAGPARIELEALARPLLTWR